MKNPFMSLWLSNANAWAGMMRGFWTAEAQRQQTQMMNAMTRQTIDFWTGGWARSLNAANTPARRKSSDR